MAISTVATAKTGALMPMWHQKAGVGISTSAPGHLHTYAYAAGQPGTQAVPSSGAAGAALTAPFTGSFPHTNPASGESKVLDVNLVGSQSVGSMYLIDRLWQNSGLSATLTTAQTVNSAAWPARDINGSTNGEGVYIAVEISTALGAAAPTFSMSYTNSAGTSGRTANNIIALVNGMQAGYIIFMGLQAGDTGVRSVQTFTLSASALSGAYSLVAFRPLAHVPNQAVASTGTVSRPVFRTNTVEDVVTLGGLKIPNSAVLQLLGMNNNTGMSYNISGSLVVAQG